MKTHWRWIELIFIYIILPIIYYFDFIPIHKFIPLIIVFAVLLTFAFRDKTFNKQVFKQIKYSEWRILLVRFTLIALASIPIIYFTHRDYLFIMPMENTFIWLMIMWFYPIFSVIPQNFIYRVFFFHRYNKLFPNEKSMIIASAIGFMFVHIIFRNWLALVLTLIGGYIFAKTYAKSQSYWVVSIEHILYGNWIFTVGIGNFFYLPT